MDLTKSIKQLGDSLKGKRWFYDVGTDKYGRLVVYTTESNEETLRQIPDRVDGIQVLVHFASSKLARPENFISPQPPPMAIPSVVIGDEIAEDEEYLDDDMEELPSHFLNADLEDLTRELDRLEKICGSNILQDIFYEIHDGKNSVTNLSARYPDVHRSLKQLYDDYGFDVIYEEMDG